MWVGDGLLIGVVAFGPSKMRASCQSWLKSKTGHGPSTAAVNASYPIPMIGTDLRDRQARPRARADAWKADERDESRSSGFDITPASEAMIKANPALGRASNH